MNREQEQNFIEDISQIRKDLDIIANYFELRSRSSYVLSTNEGYKHAYEELYGWEGDK